MTQNKKNIIIGYAIIFVVIIIPLSFIFGPVVFAGYATGLLIAILRAKKKQDTPETTKARKQQADEFITVIRPTIDTKR